MYSIKLLTSSHEFWDSFEAQRGHFLDFVVGCVEYIRPLHAVDEAVTQEMESGLLGVTTLAIRLAANADSVTVTVQCCVACDAKRHSPVIESLTAIPMAVSSRRVSIAGR